mmetsp:Transcript_32362/g.60344  ORF Transcript_32362/g.60344 Transcript_32362/m.60344 type:complete len:207 (+) Transcript_32362:8188-8808(+)
MMTLSCRHESRCTPADGPSRTSTHQPCPNPCPESAPRGHTWGKQKKRERTPYWSCRSSTWSTPAQSRSPRCESRMLHRRIRTAHQHLRRTSCAPHSRTQLSRSLRPDHYATRFPQHPTQSPTEHPRPTHSRTSTSLPHPQIYHRCHHTNPLPPHAHRTAETPWTHSQSGCQPMVTRRAHRMEIELKVNLSWRWAPGQAHSKERSSV